MYVASKVFTYVGSLEIDPGNRHVKEVATFMTEVVSDRLIRCGMKQELVLTGEHETSALAFKALADLLDRQYQAVGQYIKRLFPGSSPPQFDGAPLWLPGLLASSPTGDA